MQWVLNLVGRMNRFGSKQGYGEIKMQNEGAKLFRNYTQTIM